MKNIYELKSDTNKHLGPIFSAEQAKESAKCMAIVLQSSISVYKNGIYFARAEYPYYLRNQELETKDILYYLDF